MLLTNLLTVVVIVTKAGRTLRSGNHDVDVRDTSGSGDATGRLPQLHETNDKGQNCRWPTLVPAGPVPTCHNGHRHNESHGMRVSTLQAPSDLPIQAEAPAKEHNLGRREIPGSCPAAGKCCCLLSKKPYDSLTSPLTLCPAFGKPVVAALRARSAVQAAGEQSSGGFVRTCHNM